ncbi:hypothetical protein B0H19DRAFT_1271005 [Mycena capillaripes]|nr:hypothetical protein B0H19DRAFT_1271005 [Mycena capillaripes]
MPRKFQNIDALPQMLLKLTTPSPPSISFGKTTAGNDFEESYPGFDDAVSKPWQAHLKRCFSTAIPQRLSGAGSLSASAETPAGDVSTSPLAPIDAIAHDLATGDSLAPPPAPMDAISEEAEPFDELDFDTSPNNCDVFGYLGHSENNAPVTAWPLLMGPPSSPGTAAAAARVERGGSEVGAMYVNAPLPIDPTLLAISSPIRAATPTPVPSSGRLGTGSGQRSALSVAPSTRTTSRASSSVARIASTALAMRAPSLSMAVTSTATPSATVASPVAMSTTNAPAIPPQATPTPASETTSPTPIHIRSRPMAKPAPAAKAATAQKPNRRPGRKPGGTKAAKTAAKVTGKKAVARATKEGAAAGADVEDHDDGDGDVGNTSEVGDGGQNPNAVVLTEATNVAGPSATQPVYITSSTNETRDFNRRVDVAREAGKKAKKVDPKMHGVHVLPAPRDPRTCRPVTLPDNSDLILPVKLTRQQQREAKEKALLEALQRKAAEAAVEQPGSKHKAATIKRKAAAQPVEPAPKAKRTKRA